MIKNATLPIVSSRLTMLTACTAILISFGATPGYADKRVALIIGNGAYSHAPNLPNPIHDAQDVDAVLKRVGFETILATDLDQARMQDAAIRFARVARTADVALFYYSGHALQYDGVNYLIPVDGQLNDEADLRRMTRVDEILSDLQRAKNLRILILDSCRDNPLADDLKRSVGASRSASIGRGLARMQSPEGTIISYSTQAGRTAIDGTGRNSPYTAAFVKYIEDKEDISTVFHRISSDVYESSNRGQLPELSLSFFGEFYLNGKMQLTLEPTVAARAAPSTADIEAIFWDTIKTSRDPADFRAYMAKYPSGAFIELARIRLAALQNQVQATTKAEATGPIAAGVVATKRDDALHDNADASRRPRVATAAEPSNGAGRAQVRAINLTGNWFDPSLSVAKARITQNGSAFSYVGNGVWEDPPIPGVGFDVIGSGRALENSLDMTYRARFKNGTSVTGHCTGVLRSDSLIAWRCKDNKRIEFKFVLIRDTVVMQAPGAADQALYGVWRDPTSSDSQIRITQNGSSFSWTGSAVGEDPPVAGVGVDVFGSGSITGNSLDTNFSAAFQNNISVIGHCVGVLRREGLIAWRCKDNNGVESKPVWLRDKVEPFATPPGAPYQGKN
jgi:hypothetical protein